LLIRAKAKGEEKKSTPIKSESKKEDRKETKTAIKKKAK